MQHPVKMLVARSLLKGVAGSDDAAYVLDITLLVIPFVNIAALWLHNATSHGMVTEASLVRQTATGQTKMLFGWKSMSVMQHSYVSESAVSTLGGLAKSRPTDLPDALHLSLHTSHLSSQM